MSDVTLHYRDAPTSWDDFTFISNAKSLHSPLHLSIFIFNHVSIHTMEPYLDSNCFMLRIAGRIWKVRGFYLPPVRIFLADIFGQTPRLFCNLIPVWIHDSERKVNPKVALKIILCKLLKWWQQICKSKCVIYTFMHINIILLNINIYMYIVLLCSVLF